MPPGVFLSFRPRADAYCKRPETPEGDRNDLSGASIVPAVGG